MNDAQLQPRYCYTRAHYWLVKAQVPKSRFSGFALGEISKSKMSIGRPRVVQAFGICEEDERQHSR